MSTKAARGTKRTCQACEGRFYDLNRNPIVCPMCGATFVKDLRETQSRRAVERDEEEDVPVIAAAARSGAAAAATGAMASGENAPDISAEDDVPDIETEDTEIEGDDEDDTFLEEEEDGDDVGTLIDNPIEGDEEEA